jgi:hypothetical protein
MLDGEASMNLRRRLTVLVILAASFFALYGLGKHYSPALVRYVVIQALLEKAPAGTDPAWVSARVSALADSAPGREAGMARLMAISQQIEKIQRLTEEQMTELLGPGFRGPAGQGAR